jgi:hypothetical protein
MVYGMDTIKEELLTQEEAQEDLRDRIDSEGTQAEFAAWLGVSKQYLNDVLQGKRTPSRLLGYERVVMWRRMG